MSMADLFRLARTTTVAAAARARRLRQAVRRARADLGARAALSAAPGLRLGGDPGGRRARRHRPEVQPAARARHPARVRAARAGDPDDAAADRDRRRAQDVEVVRQLHRGDRSARRDVRQDAQHPRLLARVLVRAAARLRAAGRARAPRRQAGPRPGAGRALPRSGRGRDGRARVRPGSHRAPSRPRTCRPSSGRRTARASICRRCSPSIRDLDLRGPAQPRPGRGQARRRSRSAGASSTCPRRTVDGKVLQLGKRRFARRPRVEWIADDRPRRSAAPRDAGQRPHRRHHPRRGQRVCAPPGSTAAWSPCSPPARPSPSRRWSTSRAASTTSRRCSTG